MRQGASPLNQAVSLLCQTTFDIFAQLLLCGLPLEGVIFEPQEIAVIFKSFEEVLGQLGITKGSDPAREKIIARRLVAVAREGLVERRRLVRETLSRIALSADA